MYLDANGKVTEDSLVGYRAAGVPGTVRGLEYASQKYGKKAWADLVRPAADLASKGFVLSYGQAQGLRNAAKTLTRFPESNRIFLRNGKFYEPGETLVQPDLGRTLDRIARLGAEDFYEGETAHLLAKDMKEHGGLITVDDLKAYKAIERKPLEGKYRGYDILTAPPPSSGGVGVLQMLGILEGTGFEKAGAGSATTVHYMTEAMRRYFADRSEHLGDPDFVKVPITPVLDPKYVAKLRSTIDPERATPVHRRQAREIRPAANPTRPPTTRSPTQRATSPSSPTPSTAATAPKSPRPASASSSITRWTTSPPSPAKRNMYGLIQGEVNAIAPRKTPALRR